MEVGIEKASRSQPSACVRAWLPERERGLVESGHSRSHQGLSIGQLSNESV